MGTPLLQQTQYVGIRTQSLQRVLIYAPTLIWVTQGSKLLWWKEKRIRFDKQQWMLIPAGHQLTFINQPEQGKFRSHAVTLLTPPPREWLNAQQPQAVTADHPGVAVTPALHYCFELITNMNERGLTVCAQGQLLQAFYAQLHAAGGLDLLYPAHSMSLAERISRYISVEPGAEHTLETIAPHFSMSRASLVRKLAAEGRSFRQLLAQIRMGHALNLLQQATPPIEVAIACGYDSISRFSARFKQEFGLTPSQYQHTCPHH